MNSRNANLILTFCGTVLIALVYVFCMKHTGAFGTLRGTVIVAFGALASVRMISNRFLDSLQSHWQAALSFVIPVLSGGVLIAIMFALTFVQWLHLPH